MNSKPDAFTSIQVSDELRCQVIPLVRQQAAQFTSVEDHFFIEGEALSSEAERARATDESGGAPSRRRWLGRKSSLVAVVGAVVIVGTVLLIRSGGQAADRSTLGTQSPPPALSPRPAAARAVAKFDKPAVVPDEPAKVPAPAPADDHGDSSRQSHPSPEDLPPHPGLASAGAEAGSRADAMDECKKAFDRHRSKDVLAKCADAFTGDRSSVDAAVMLAKTEFDRGHMVQALDWAKKAIALGADRADAYVFVGGAEQTAGHKTAAKVAYKRYLQLAPQGRYAADLRAVLTTL
jgi:hypothetical protein